jgi:Flp pilus assembly protein TadG
MLSLEAVLVLPVLALLAVSLLQVAVLVRDVLIVHEAARAGARAAATTTGASAPTRAARAAAPELAGITVSVTPVSRREGDLVRVEVRATRRIAGVSHGLRARAVALVEPSARAP